MILLYLTVRDATDKALPRSVTHSYDEQGQGKEGGSAALVLDPYRGQHLLPQRVQVAHSDVLARFSGHEHDVIAVYYLEEKCG